MFPFESTWLPYLYLYGVGGFFFLLGMIIIKKSGSLDKAKKSHRRWFKILLFGFFYFTLIHAFLITAALYFLNYGS
ncbi:MAG: hypothetical protein HXY48_09800 [Ignavibacteriaceae bacterium]|nr:hypothetical protein [Ignavibacteriaceae bacterium]